MIHKIIITINICRFITDSISTVAFGFNCNSLKDPETQFRKFGILGTDIGKYTAVLSIFGSNILDFLRLRVFKEEVNSFFIKTFEDVVKYRVKEKVVRNDFINMLMSLTNHEQYNDEDPSNGKPAGGNFLNSFISYNFSL